MPSALSARRSRAILALLVALLLLATSFVAAAAAPLARAAVATLGHATPAIGARPLVTYEGHATPDATTFSCQTTTPAGCYGPAQVRAAYGVDVLAATKGLDGTGRSITIVDAYSSPTITHDLTTFDSLFDLPAAQLNIIAPDGLTPFDQNDPNQVSWAGEITLDVEYAHAIAPGATINLVLAKTNNDADIQSAQRYVIDRNLGDVLSQSFGEAEQCMDPTLLAQSHALFVKAAKERMTVFASAGDQGSAQPTCDGTSYFAAASTPASDPYVTGVGGTILDADGITGAYHSETTWNEPDFASAGGGGYSVSFGEPVYQLAAQRSRTRAVPDVAYNAAIIGGVLAVWSSSGQGADLVFRFGGTSAGSPQWSGLLALTDQLRRGRAGFINPALYGLALLPKVYSKEFNDVTTGDNTYHGAVTIPGYPAGKGWDAATGLGSPKAQNLVPALAILG